MVVTDKLSRPWLITGMCAPAFRETGKDHWPSLTVRGTSHTSHEYLRVLFETRSDGSCDTTLRRSDVIIEQRYADC